MNKISEDQVRLKIHEYLKPKFEKEWFAEMHPNPAVNKLFSTASKSSKSNKGFPDLIYFNENKNILILSEIKSDYKKHDGPNKKDADKIYAKAGIKSYLKSIIDKNDEYWNKVNVIGFAFSGQDINEQDHLVDTYIIKNNETLDVNVSELLSESQYLTFFDEQVETNLTYSAAKINRILRNMEIGSDKKSTLVSALMISIYNSGINRFKNLYRFMTGKTFFTNIIESVESTLKEENIPDEKINVLLSEISFLKESVNFKYEENIKNIISELIVSILPIIRIDTSLDVVGKFYEEFLKYAGLYNVKKGIVLTPRHITNLFTKLVPLEVNDIIFDPACGTGSFLIAGMNKINEKISNSNFTDKSKRMKNVAQNQLIGFEKNSMMYTLSISNMLFRHDGKSSIWNYDFFSKEAENEINRIKPTIGFMNPPYSGQDSDANPTKKEIQFIERLLNSVSKYAVIITPHSTLFKDEKIRNRILKNHKLLSVISMPTGLFQPTATIGTSILIFKTNETHNFEEKVKFYDLIDDGFVLNKSNGRIDHKGNWNKIEAKLLESLINGKKDSDLYFESKISETKTWALNEFKETKINGEFLTKENFINKTINYLAYKKSIDLNNLNEWRIVNEILNKINFDIVDIDLQKFKEFSLSEIFSLNIETGSRLESANIAPGETNFVTATSTNNGVSEKISIENSFNNKNKISPTFAPFKITMDKFGNAFFQEEEFAASDSVVILSCDDLSLNRALFLTTILELEKNRYSFGYSLIPARMIKKIKLPAIKVNDKYLPDWEYMENYIRKIFL